MTIAIVLFILVCLSARYGNLQSLARSRKYKSGTGWCFWRWTDVRSEYITRLHVVKTPWCALCLHWINKPDAEPWLHDHPVSFLSIILRGGYAEKRWSPSRGEYIKLNSWWNFIRATDADRHRIILTRANTLTLCFMGPKTREWGFHMPAGWIMWKDYYKRLRAGEDMRGEKLYGSGNYGEGAYGPLDVRARVDEFNAVTNALTVRHLTIAGDAQYPRTLVDKTGRIIDPAPAEDFDAEEITDEWEPS